MVASEAAARNIKADPDADFDAVIIGAGVSVLYQLYRLRELGLKVRVFETGTGVGGTRRVPLETRYYEVYNQPNVKLVDINETPIERITPDGIKTSDTEYEFDLIIYATGFDAITGSFDRIDIRGADGCRLKEMWKDGPQTFLGILVEGFPNLLMVMGPHAALGNFPRAAQYSVEWVTGLVRFARERGLTRIEATAAGAAEWTDHVTALGEGLLMNEIDSWMTGVNRNVEGKQTRKIMRYSGGHPAFREHCDAVAADGYRKLALA